MPSPQVVGERWEVERWQQDAVHAVAQPHAQPIARGRHRIQLAHYVLQRRHRIRAHPSITRQAQSNYGCIQGQINVAIA